MSVHDRRLFDNSAQPIRLGEPVAPPLGRAIAITTMTFVAFLAALTWACWPR